MNKLKTILLVSTFALVAGAGGVQAALVNFTLTGTLDTADLGNDFGLSSGDEITVTGSFNDSLLTGSGAEDVLFSAGSGNSLVLDVGSMSFTEVDDTNYSLGTFPKLSFLDGSFDGFDLLIEFGSFGYFSTVGTFFDAEDDNFNSNYISGNWTNYSVAAVPVPAAVWLFGSGLLGLAGVARRKS